MWTYHFFFFLIIQSKRNSELSQFQTFNWAHYKVLWVASTLRRAWTNTVVNTSTFKSPLTKERAHWSPSWGEEQIGKSMSFFSKTKYRNLGRKALLSFSLSEAPLLSFLSLSLSLSFYTYGKNNKPNKTKSSNFYYVF